jgi:diguanylate cyclase (GGDEF)-like protein
VPVLVVTEHGEVDARLALRRAGASAILAHPAEATSLVEGIDELTRARQPEPYRVLILEDDLLLGDHMARTLQAAGMLAQVVADPLRMAGPIEQFKPDLVLIDALLDGCSGTELAWVIRQDDRHLGMGILFLATPPVARRLAGDLRRQGEDHLLLPVTDVELVESIRVRARRARRMCSRMEMDGRTGLLAPVRFQDRMDHEVSRCVRHGLIVAMGLVDLDNSQELDERFGPGAREQVIGRLARLLRQRLRRTDIIGRVGPDEVGVLMPHTTAGQAHKVLENVRLLFAATPFVSDRGEEFHVTISAGISTCPVHVQPSQLNRAATRALDAAKDRGRNLVLSETDVSP